MNFSIAKNQPLFIAIGLILSFFMVSLNINAQAGTHQIGQTIMAKGPSDDAFCSVSMPDFKTIAVNVPVSGSIAPLAGYVRVFRWNGTAWIQKGQAIDSAGHLDRYGYVLDMPDSNTLAIGLPLIKNSNGLVQAGRVMVFRWDGNAWQQKGGYIDGEVNGDGFGNSLSMADSNTIAIGAPYNDGSIGLSGVGHVRIYRWNGTNWIQKGTEINGNQLSELTGGSVSMPDSNTVAIGANHYDGIGTNSGRVRVYKWNGQAWAQKGSDINGKSAGDRFGESISMPNANTLAVGAPYNSDSGTHSGEVRIFLWTGNNWVQKGNDINGLGAGDGFGTSLSMPDPEVLSVGAPRVDTSGSLLGYAGIYYWDGVAWNPNSSMIWGDTAKSNTGWSVSMPNKNTLAVGSPKLDLWTLDSGEVRVYYICGEIEPGISKPSCGTDSIILNFDSPILCNTISGNEFRLISMGDSIPRPITLVDTGVCDQGYTQNIQLTLHRAITENDTFILTIKQGSDGNTFMNLCGEWLPDNTNIGFSVNDCNGGLKVPRQESPKGISLYPTAAGDEITLNLGELKNTSSTELQILNNGGQLIRKWRLIPTGKEELKIDISSLPRGIYFLQLLNEQRTTTRRFIKI